MRGICQPDEGLPSDTKTRKVFFRHQNGNLAGPFQTKPKNIVKRDFPFLREISFSYAFYKGKMKKLREVKPAQRSSFLERVGLSPCLVVIGCNIHISCSFT